ncbi:hypothetical protein GCM10009840_23750 [Pseudolysinimonas kribbensis]|uniref:DUF1579 domain-containing protein n=1 Tax=Pseudolysinimonas kribbensis TaxID=433641 RepID=A0ABQ6KB63_9MICO|nr:hypothetical protein [Pseudolysinimonas kribbensis]GMA96871.1 hypothetical protein GCM10025881_36950 [Pseudolysinimonas kribbensis]
MIGTAALIPNPALRPLEVVVGQWRTTGTHPLMPGTTFRGRTSFAWLEGGAFLVMRTEMEQAEVPDAVAVIGSDDAAGTLTMSYFDERGVSRRYEVEFADGRLSWSRDEAGFAQRQTLVLSEDRSRMTGTGRMRRGGE